MILGVVGHAAEKFIEETKELAKSEIRKACASYRPSRLSSGHSPMGGVDIWAEEVAKELGIDMSVHAPTKNCWSGVGGFMDRNLRIAKESDVVLVVVTDHFPPGYKGMRFPECYHCKGRNPPHIKSGGCWTAWKSKSGDWRIIGLPKTSQT